MQLLGKSGLESAYQLDTVKGSHLVLNRKCHQAYLLEVPEDKRVFFVLPWKELTLLGTTEIRHKIDDPVVCSDAEQDYLLRAYNHYYRQAATQIDVLERFSGLRPLLYSSQKPNKASREYVIQRNKQLINVFGGKWTTALALAKKVKVNLN